MTIIWEIEAHLAQTYGGRGGWNFWYKKKGAVAEPDIGVMGDGAIHALMFSTYLLPLIISYKMYSWWILCSFAKLQVTHTELHCILRLGVLSSRGPSYY